MKELPRAPYIVIVQVCTRGYIGGIISAGGPALPAFQREIIVGRVPDADDDNPMMHMEFDGFLSVENAAGPEIFCLRASYVYVDNGVPLPFSLSLSLPWQKKLNKRFAEDLRRDGSRSRLKSKRIRFQCNFIDSCYHYYLYCY